MQVLQNLRNPVKRIFPYGTIERSFDVWIYMGIHLSLFTLRLNIVKNLNV